MNVTLPDGTTLNGVPEGTTKFQLLAKLHKNGYDIKPLLENINPANISDPTAGMSGVEKFTAGAGKAFVDLSRGARQLLPGDNTQLNQDVAESRRLDAPLMKTGAGIAGNLTGNVAALAPTAFIPGANTYTGAALIGAGSGLLSPTMADESKLANAKLGAISGTAGQGLGRALGRAIRPVQPSLSPELSNLAQAAQREGIPLRASQITGSKPLALTESVMENLPLTSASQIAKKSGQKSAFTEAVLRKTGAMGDKATPEVLSAQKSALGSTFEDISTRSNLNFDTGLSDKLNSIVQEASQRLPPDKAAHVASVIKNIMSGAEPGAPEKVVQSAILNESGKPFSNIVPATSPIPMPGTLYQGWREPLRKLAKGDDLSGHYFGQIRKELDSAFGSQLAPADAATWKTASRQYGNLKNVMQAMGGAGVDTLSGNIPPAQLAQALTRQVGKEGKSLGRGDLNELTKVGRAFISENLPDSGTAQRSFYQNLLTGNLASAGLGVGGGAGIGYMYGGPQGALEGAGIGSAATLGGPKLVQALMNSKAGQAYLTKGVIPISQTQRDILAQALRLSGTGAASQMLQNR